MADRSRYGVACGPVQSVTDAGLSGNRAMLGSVTHNPYGRI
jgi:hypothetical protein